MEANQNVKIPDDQLVSAANFVLQKFLLRTEVINKEGKILENELHDLETKVKLKKINSVIQKN